MPVRSALAILAVSGAFALANQSAGAAASAQDAALRERIEANLAALDDREGADVRVAVRNGEVVLQGSVRVLEQSLRAEQAAWRTPGVIDVDNELRVTPGTQGDVAIEREVRLIIKGDGRFLDTTLELRVANGLVSIRGMFQDPTDVLRLKHRIAAVPGVLAVEIDAQLVAQRRVPAQDAAAA